MISFFELRVSSRNFWRLPYVAEFYLCDCKRRHYERGGKEGREDPDCSVERLF